MKKARTNRKPTRTPRRLADSSSSPIARGREPARRAVQPEIGSDGNHDDDDEGHRHEADLV